MNRRKLFEFLVPYLLFLFLVFLLTGIFFAVRGHALYSLAGTLALFFLASVPLILWFGQMKASVEELVNAVRELDSGNWNAPLPSSGIEEIWSWISSFHAARNSLREKMANLEGEKEKLSRILSNLREGILVTDPANRIVMANETVANFLGVSSSDLAGKPLTQFMEGDLRAVFESLIRGEEKSEKVSMSGPERFFLFRTFLSKNPGGNLVAKGVVLRDITESQKVEEMRKAFVANASHELRSPVAGLQALLDAFEMGGLDDSQQRKKFLAMMSREVNRLNAIIQDLLDLSELEREREFTKEQLHIVKLFQEWLKNYDLQLKKKEIHLSTLFEDREIVMSGSLPDMERLFRNLFENALKYTQAGGSIEIGLRKANGDLEGWIKDTGIGIPREDLSRIFERFYRVDKSRSRSLGGTGLGLSIARHAVERHGGKIWVESREAEGSTFHFVIPLTCS